ncbi:hypothetical protein GLAREA_10724 [Glarea lozoyensis ATCC 20868]|uniref:BTB domain-containing protein n=1 Tax=Glarea lozoyensis (strain ATCC 20868 / MF5171) TaxID=1116229 RepID=S3DD49_GLAL2|nr:uncharacterized protein GLAREA_10724 [Glarea lozoyensis ATCC 20868]EPE35029.1 hypothetical protein GLAREA_10724 [Glarea lozoyensis ATCC 20868]
MIRQLSHGSGTSSSPNAASPKIKGFWQGRRKKSSVSSGCPITESPTSGSLFAEKIFVRNHNEDPIPTSPLTLPELEPCRSNGLPSPDPSLTLSHDAEYLHLKEHTRRLKKAPAGSDPKKVDATWEIYKKVRDECLQLCRSLLEKSHSSGRNPSLDVNPEPSDARSSCSGSLMEAPSNTNPGDQRLAAIQEYKGILEQMVDNFRTCLLITYAKNEPDASEEQKRAFLDDMKVRKGLIMKWRDASIHAMKSEKLLYWEQFKIRSLNFDRLKLDLLAISKISDTPEPTFDGDTASQNIREYVIARQGDTILEFENKSVEGCQVLRFRVSSHLLAESSPFFAQMLLPQPPGAICPVDMDNQLPGPAGRHVCKDGIEVKIYRMPQIEMNVHESLTILLHAAHMHNNKVPRQIDFPVFVSIAEVCLRYHCTAPLELQVEYQWLPQWIHMASDNSPDGLLLISYTFGLRRLFSRMSKSAILNSLDDDEIQSRETWPQAIRDKIRAVRGAKIAQINDRCTKALEEYFRPPIEHMDRKSSVGSLQLTAKPRCPKGQHLCDATNLGWLMLVYNELRVLPSLMNEVGFQSLPKPPRRSLKALVDSLRLMPSAPQVHDGVCDYAPAFRSAIDDIYNSVRGLTFKEVSGKDGWGLSKHAGPDDSEDDLHEIVELPGNVRKATTSRIRTHVSEGPSDEVGRMLGTSNLSDDSDDLIEEDQAVSTSNSPFSGGSRGLSLPHIAIPREKEEKFLAIEKSELASPLSPLSGGEGDDDLYNASPLVPSFTQGAGEIEMSAEEAHRILWPDDEYAGPDTHPEENEKVLLDDIKRFGGKPKANICQASARAEDKAKVVADGKHLRDEKDKTLGLGLYKHGCRPP